MRLPEKSEMVNGMAKGLAERVPMNRDKLKARKGALKRKMQGMKERYNG